jgi:hypothetical protein
LYRMHPKAINFPDGMPRCGNLCCKIAGGASFFWADYREGAILSIRAEKK